MTEAETTSIIVSTVQEALTLIGLLLANHYVVVGVERTINMNYEVKWEIDV